MSTRENIRLIAKAPLLHGVISLPDAMSYEIQSSFTDQTWGATFIRENQCLSSFQSIKTTLTKFGLL